LRKKKRTVVEPSSNGSLGIAAVEIDGIDQGQDQNAQYAHEDPTEEQDPGGRAQKCDRHAETQQRTPSHAARDCCQGALLCVDRGSGVGFPYYDRDMARRRFGERHLEYHIEFFQAGLNAVLHRWLDGNCRETPEELLQIIQEEYGRMQSTSLA